MGEYAIGRACSFTLSGDTRHGVIERVGHSEALGTIVIVMCDDSAARGRLDRRVLSGEIAGDALASVVG